VRCNDGCNRSYPVLFSRASSARRNFIDARILRSLRALSSDYVTPTATRSPQSVLSFRQERCVSTPRQPFYRSLQRWAERKILRQKAHLYEAILLVNRGLDEAVQGLERLKRIKNSGLDAACFEEKLTLFEIHRASLNSYFCNNVGRNEDLDTARFRKIHREYEKNILDEIQVYRELQAVEDRRRIEGKPPKVRFLTEEEQREWERQYPKPPEEAASEIHPEAGGRP
jgi:hypothetical protein